MITGEYMMKIRKHLLLMLVTVFVLYSFSCGKVDDVETTNELYPKKWTLAKVRQNQHPHTVDRRQKAPSPRHGQYKFCNPQAVDIHVPNVSLSGTPNRGRYTVPGRAAFSGY